MQLVMSFNSQHRDKVRYPWELGSHVWPSKTSVARPLNARHVHFGSRCRIASVSLHTLLNIIGIADQRMISLQCYEGIGQNTVCFAVYACHGRLKIVTEPQLYTARIKTTEINNDALERHFSVEEIKKVVNRLIQKRPRVMTFFQQK